MLQRYEAPSSSDEDSVRGSSSSAEESSSSSTSPKPQQKKPRSDVDREASRIRNISWNQLQSLETSNMKEMTTFQQNGRNKERIRKAMKQNCCTSGCKQKLNFGMVWKLCVAFWCLSKAAQDGLSRDKIFKKS